MMARYRALSDLIVRTTHPTAGRVKAGETFHSDAVPGRNWEPLDDEARAAVKARFGPDATNAAKFLFPFQPQPFRPFR